MTNLKRLDLKTKAAILIVTILVATIGLTTVVLSLEINRKLKTALLSTAELMGKDLAKEVSDILDMGIDLSQLEGFSLRLTEAVGQTSNLGYIYIADEKANVLSFSNNIPDWIIEKARLPKSLEEESATSEIDHLKDGGTGFYQLSLPIRSLGRLQGYLALGLTGNVISQQIRSIQKRMVLIGFFSFILAAGFTVIFVNRIISVPLANLAGIARQISDGRIIEPEVTSRSDEIGQLSDAFRVMAGQLTGMFGRFSETSLSLMASSIEFTSLARDLSLTFGKQTDTFDDVVGTIKEIEGFSQDLSIHALNLSDSANESAASITESTTAISQINENMAEINTAIENITSSILQMSATFGELAEGAEKSAELAEETMEAVSRINNGVKNMENMVKQAESLAGDLKVNARDIGSNAVRETLEGILSIQEDVQNSEFAMKQLNEKVDNIGDIVTVIQDIADQTNLLALNAAIISAQAGEEGKGFSVIASEIRDLSAGTTESTQQISALVQSVQEEARNYTGYVKKVKRSVEEGHARGLQATEALEKIVQAANDSARMSGEISTVTKEQALASEKVAGSIEIFTERAEAIRRATSEEAQTARFIRESMEKAKNMVGKVYRSTEEQSRTSQMISDMVLKAEEIAGRLQGAMEKEKELFVGLFSSVESLRAMNRDNFERIKVIERSTEILTELSSSLGEELKRFRVEGGRGAPSKTSKP